MSNVVYNFALNVYFLFILRHIMSCFRYAQRDIDVVILVYLGLCVVYALHSDIVLKRTNISSKLFHRLTAPLFQSKFERTRSLFCRTRPERSFGSKKFVFALGTVTAPKTTRHHLGYTSHCCGGSIVRW